MSFLNSLTGVTSGLGRGLEDLFTLGTAELARKYGGSGADKAFGIVDKGAGSNWMAGAAGGLGMLGAGAGGGGGMSAYMPTSTPVMGQAGSTLGAGMGSSMNLSPAYGSATGAAAGAPVASAATPSSLLQLMRLPTSGGGGQQPATGANQQRTLEMIMKMFPALRPGANMNQGMTMGGGFGG